MYCRETEGQQKQGIAKEAKERSCNRGRRGIAKERDCDGGKREG